jgi:hypothetical protein
MTLNASGPISLGGSVIGQSIQYEIYETTSNLITLNDPKVRALAQVPSGAIVMPQNFYGKTYTQFFTITTSQVNFNLLTYLNANGWDPLARADVTIAPGVYIYSNSTGTPGMVISGLFKKGVKITNNGFIVGMGGRGGNGTGGAGLVGLPGGLALSVSSAVTINNTSGTIGGGGGGGGGGAGYTFTCPCTGSTTTYVGGGGGGGRTGLVNSLSGTGYGAGNQGTSLSGGTGGAGAPPATTSGGGGNGGNWGSNGGNGGNSAISGLAGGAGGAAGAAITGNTNITWEGFGTRLGAIS